MTGAQGDGGVASAQPRFGRLRARALGLAADPLARSSYSLLANTAANSALGVAFWVSAARLFHPAQVGVDSATIAAFTLLSNLGQFSLSSALERFLPRTGRGARGFVAKWDRRSSQPAARRRAHRRLPARALPAFPRH